MYPVITRVKAIESVAEKIESGRYQSFEDIDDLVAATLVVPTLRDEHNAIAYCREIFEVISEKRRSSARKPPELFRFDATRLYARLRAPDGIDPDVESISKIVFEVQIRTAFEHAWIVTTHPLTYKSQEVNWKRFRIAAQLKASAEWLDTAVESFEALAAAVVEAPWPEIDSKKSAADLIKRLIDANIIPLDVAPKDISRFAENLIAVLQSSSNNVAIEDAIATLENEIRKIPPDSFPRSISILQICIGILCRGGVITPPFRRYRYHVTEQLASIYPEVRMLAPIFSYSEADS